MKLKATCDSYGFLGRYHYKDSIVEVEPGTKYPEGQFEEVDKKVKENPESDSPNVEKPKHKKQK